MARPPARQIQPTPNPAPPQHRGRRALVTAWVRGATRFVAALTGLVTALTALVAACIALSRVLG